MFAVHTGIQTKVKMKLLSSLHAGRQDTGRSHIPELARWFGSGWKSEKEEEVLPPSLGKFHMLSLVTDRARTTRNARTSSAPTRPRQ
jgi:hypothetical protein